ncbi:hypothetical protein PtA15_14A404 [Puccinia triticina]|uniref:Uncharacterized protein n=1 Tax=Puccinia triticina TaxID=208348 RepID=A0ABY7D6A8_9BASI|nr:uncharacterized protein PtA15_14A404 [Puccinia triticina]WAQ91520.1 hypothetical protein PtA15_14A404 [Puccinia triticina]
MPKSQALERCRFRGQQVTTHEQPPQIEKHLNSKRSLLAREHNSSLLSSGKGSIADSYFRVQVERVIAAFKSNPYEVLDEDMTEQTSVTHPSSANSLPSIPPSSIVF